MKKILFSLTASVFILSACGGSSEEANTDVDTEDVEVVQQDKEIDSSPEVAAEEVEPEESWKEALEGIDLDSDNPEEIPWDEINLTKKQFDEFLVYLTDDSGATEEEITMSSVDFDGDTIHLVIENKEEDPEIAELSNAFFVMFMDSYLRQFYLVSDYSDGEIHPTIVIEDVNHGTVSELDDFIEFEE